MMQTVWLSTLIIKIDGLTFSQDCYGVDNGHMLIIGSKSYNGVTEVVESWSC